MFTSPFSVKMNHFILFVLSCIHISMTTTATDDITINNRPIIAVLSQRYPKNSNQSYIAASYVKYLESAGARVVPIPHYFPASKVAELFQYVNGVLFPGGGVKMFTSDFYKHAKLFYELTKQANDRKDYFPIWATCLGFQVLHVMETGLHEVISKAPASDTADPLNFTAEAKTSKLFKNMPQDLYTSLSTEEITYNHHNYGITTEMYKKYDKLNKFYNILSVNKDTKGGEYVSTIEAYNYPIYGVQWHPEKHNFEFGTHFKNIPHSYPAVMTSQYMANFFVNEARKSLHRFPTANMEAEYLIYQYTPVHSFVKFHNGTLNHFEQVYLF